MDKHKLTNAAGAPVANNTDTMTAGARGPVLLQDVWALEKLAHFDREVIPERRMHAKGSGAYGHLTVTHDITRFTRAKVLQPGTKTEMFARFSTVAGERGAADAERDIRGFALKFYTQDGIWDLVGNNTPTFFLRDSKNFMGLNRAVKRDPKTNLHSAQSMWDFWSMLPESLLQRTITMSDEGIPASYRNMNGFGGHTFALYNKLNQRTWCKFHFHTQQGLKYLTDEEAAAIIAVDRDSNQRDLFNAIERAQYPRWKMYIQVMTEEQANNHYENPFDITKPWRESEFPLLEVGFFELNRNPHNYFADVEQAAFSPANVVPGIGFSPDKLLQGRLFSYGDAQRYRLGVNFNEIPVNKSRVPIFDNHRDGKMRVDGNYGATIGYTPNGYGLWPDQPEVTEPPLPIEGDAYTYNPYKDQSDDLYRAPGELYRDMSEPERQRLAGNTARSIKAADRRVKYRHATQCYKADKEYGERIAKALGLEPRKVADLAKLPDEEILRVTRLY